MALYCLPFFLGIQIFAITLRLYGIIHILDKQKEKMTELALRQEIKTLADQLPMDSLPQIVVYLRQYQQDDVVADNDERCQAWRRLQQYIKSGVTTPSSDNVDERMEYLLRKHAA